jgi:hypothetical protein
VSGRLGAAWAALSATSVSDVSEFKHLWTQGGLERTDDDVELLGRATVEGGPVGRVWSGCTDSQEVEEFWRCLESGGRRIGPLLAAMLSDLTAALALRTLGLRRFLALVSRLVASSSWGSSPSDCPSTSRRPDGYELVALRVRLEFVCQAAIGSWTKSRQWDTHRTWFSSARSTRCSPAKVNGVWPANDAWLRAAL